MKIDEILSPSPVFYSALTRAVETLPQPKATAQQWAATIRNLGAKGVKQAEINWSGVLDWLGQTSGSISKQNLLDYLRAHEVQVQHKIQGTVRDDIKPDAQAQRDYGAAWQQQVDRLHQAEASHDQSVYDAINQDMDAIHAKMVDDTMARQELSGKAPVYHDPKYRLPGGTDYREMLITTPAKEHEVKVGPAQSPGAEYGNNDFVASWEGLYQVQGVKDYPFTIGAGSGRITYWPKTFNWKGNEAPAKYIVDATFLQNGHFDTMEQSIAAIKERYNNDHARPDVYKSAHWRNERNVLAHTRMDTRRDKEGRKILHVAEVQSDWHQSGRKRGYNTKPNIEIKEETRDGRTVFAVYVNGKRELSYPTREKAEQYAPEQRNTKAIPDAPFKKDWPVMAIKRLLRYAAEHDYDRLTWDVGATSTKRYDLSQKISRIAYIPDTKTIFAYDKRRQNVLKKVASPEELPDIIGKEAAAKLLAQPLTYDPKLSGPHVPAPSVQSLEGLELKVGGEGMQGFYDQILPSMINKYINKWGGKVTQGKVDISKDPTRRQYAPSWSVDISPQMRDDILQGQPMWETMAF